MAFSASIEKLIEEFEKLPSIGHKTAVRLAFYVLNSSEEVANDFAKAILDARKNLKFCSICNNITDVDPCPICSNPKRNKDVICVVEDVKNIFGYDSDGDLIIDKGIAYQMDKQLTAYVQSGGIFAMKTTSLDGKIKASEQKISRLETQMNDKEADLKNKYGRMQGALNSLENQQNSIQNFSRQKNQE